MATLHLLMGLPGSGKTTLAKLIQKETGAVRISSDDFRLLLFPEPTFSQDEHDNLYALIDHNVEHLLQSGHDVVYDANLNRRVHRDEKYEMAKKHRSETKLWWVKTDQNLSRQRRLDEQDDRLVTNHESADDMFTRIAELIEEPGADEPYIEIEGVGLTRERVKKLNQ